jgi:Holliday junction resolvase RusA-like endonuclease
MSLILKLPYPNPSLNPNKKNGTHWGKTKQAKDDGFVAGFYVSQSELKNRKIINKQTELIISFIQKDNRHRDLDNLLSASKSVLDGIAKSLQIDDKFFNPITLKKEFNKEKSQMIVEIKCEFIKENTSLL